MNDLIEFLKTPVGAGLVGIVLIAIGMGMLKLKISPGTKALCKVLGVLALGYGLAVGLNIPITIGPTNGPATTVSEFDVLGSESHSYVTVDQSGRTFVWTTGYDHSGDTITGPSQATFSFSITRALGNTGTVQTSASVVSIPDVTNSTTGLSSPVISKSGTQYNAIWQRPDGTQAIMSITATIGESSDGILLSLNLTLSPAGVKNMSLYDMEQISLNVAGESWAISILLTG